MAEIFRSPLGGLGLAVVTAADVLDRQRAVRNILKVKIFRQFRERHAWIDILVRTGEGSDPSADIVGIDKVSHHKIRLLLILLQKFQRLIGSIPVNIGVVIGRPGRTRVRDGNLGGGNTFESVQCSGIMAFAKVDRPIAGIAKYTSDGGERVGHIIYRPAPPVG